MGQYSVNVLLIVVIELTHPITTEMKSQAFWMTDMYDRIKDKTICDVLIPGTVLSTSYQIGTNTELSVYNEPLLDLANVFGLSQVSDMFTVNIIGYSRLIEVDRSHSKLIEKCVDYYLVL